MPRQERVNDTAKLMMHRLVARAIGRDPSLVERAKAELRGPSGYSNVQDWNDILSRPTIEIRRLLTRRDENMTRLRLSSPFVLADGVDFTDQKLRHRIWRAAKHALPRPDGQHS